ncbi:hypothetical protein HMPREF0063_11760 [Aeromicrobium marinum DSM 15272]|uniref:Thioesterase family protein n=1 Tax=Aeromicrobium marinum DSM 15272 TaxID=585531 RepID=E2SDH4_9ACTN|nr:hypothetical protein [Aeromicrobium marinum]EFQ82551.1 hypothetical protein HMPREF0063_11760 [Aeromicrobium marinum DSM 15272]
MVTIAPRFNGPDHSGNGGYVAGLVAEALGRPGPVTSTLRLPPPLATPLAWEHGDDEVRLETHGGAVVGTAVPGEFSRAAPAFADTVEIAAGLAAYPGFHHHPFDHCFTCGTARAAGDGLRIFTGPTTPGRTAGSWSVHPDHADAGGAVGTPVAWAGLDCPGGWAADFTLQPMVLGRMTAEVVRPPRAGEQLHAAGELHVRDGRKFHTSTALYTAAAELVGRAEQTWIEIDLAQFG